MAGRSRWMASEASGARLETPALSEGREGPRDQGDPEGLLDSEDPKAMMDMLVISRGRLEKRVIGGLSEKRGQKGSLVKMAPLVPEETLV